MILMTCAQCQKSVETKPDKRGSLRTPNGWKRFREQLWCKNCWQRAFVLRAITFPLAAPVAPLTWEQLRPLLKNAWAQSTELANWIVTELSKADVVRNPSMDNCPPAPKIYLYPLARARFPDLTPSSLVAVEHAVRSRYNRDRIETIWRSNRSLQRFRYPFPYPVPAQAWSAHWLNGDRVPVVSIVLGGTRVELRLGTKHGKFKRQVKEFANIIEDNSLPGTLEIYEQSASISDQRKVFSDGKRPKQIMVKIAVWRPVSEKAGNQIMKVSTAIDCFLRCELATKEDWILQADHVWRWIAEYNSRRWNLDEDRKWEKRWPKHTRQQMNNIMGIWSDKHHRRLATWIHESTAHLIAYAKRQNVSTIEYNDETQQYADAVNFPWANLRTTLADKCQQNAIEFRHMNASGDVVNKDNETLASTETTA